jgi:predicted dithiol-disulfide oxidoreductase (DUF899 family)
MTKHKTGSRDQPSHRYGSAREWLAARLKLLKAEKELTRQSDEIARRRQELPWVKIDKEYKFETDEGKSSLADLFRGRSQLLVYHFMFGPDYKAGCPSCSAIADGFNGFAVHLANHDVMLWAVSRAPLAQLQEYKRRIGWTFPWASSAGSDFNFDFDVSFTPEQQREGIEYNYRREPPSKSHSRLRTAWFITRTPRIRAEQTVFGACTNGSTERPRDATRMAVSGGNATTSTRKVTSGE